jgi:hypothetical protein
MTSKMFFGRRRDVASFFRKAKPPVKTGSPEQILSLMVRASQSDPTVRNKLINIRKAGQSPGRILTTTKEIIEATSSSTTPISTPPTRDAKPVHPRLRAFF